VRPRRSSLRAEGWLLVLVAAAAACAAGGCRPIPSAGEARPPLPAPAADPCAERLHDLCGPLLLYRAVHGNLPDRLEDLRRVAGAGEDLRFECPASGQPYLYDKTGIAVPGQPGRIVVRDPLPSHSGIRWAIAMVGSDGRSDLQSPNAGVVALREN